MTYLRRKGYALVDVLRRVKPGVLALLTVLAFCLPLTARWSASFPSHVDEWTHLAYADALVRTGRVPHTEPLYGQDAVGFRPELGFRVLLAEIETTTGLDWESMFPVLPAFLFALFVVSMFYLGKAMGAGILVGVLAIGTPTTVRFLGPALAVPVSIGLTLLAVSATVLLTPRLRQGWAGPLITGILLLGMLLIHPITALVGASVTSALALFHILRLRKREDGERRRYLWATLALSVLLPSLWCLVTWRTLGTELVAEVGRNVESGQGLVRDFVYYVGYFRLAVIGISAFAITFWGVLEDRQPAYVCILALCALIMLFVGLHAVGLLPFSNLYDRVWLYLDMVLSVLGGVGLALLVSRWFRGRSVFQWLQPLLAVSLVAFIALNAWYVRSNEPQYALTSGPELEDFRWIRSNLEDVPGLTLLDPLTAVVYPSVAGRPVFASASMPKPSAGDRVVEAVRLLRAQQPDLDALTSNGIGIVYRPGWHTSDGFEEVRPGVFILSGGPDGEDDASVPAG